MRRRLMLVMVGLVAVVLVIAGAGSLILTRNAARNQAQQQLVSEAESLTSSKAAPQHLGVLAAIRKTLKLEDADLITITALGNVVTALPDGSHRTGHRRGGPPVGADQLGPQGQPRLRRGAGHAHAGGTGEHSPKPTITPVWSSAARWPFS